MASGALTAGLRCQGKKHFVTYNEWYFLRSHVPRHGMLRPRCARVTGMPPGSSAPVLPGGVRGRLSYAATLRDRALSLPYSPYPSD